MRSFAIHLACLAAAVVVGMLFWAAVAQAHPTSWRWNSAKAALSILDEGLQFRDGFQEVYDARCYGFGPWLEANERSKTRMFKHFRCHVSTFSEMHFWIELHVTGKSTRVFRFLRWAE